MLRLSSKFQNIHSPAFVGNFINLYRPGKSGSKIPMRSQDPNPMNYPIIPELPNTGNTPIPLIKSSLHDNQKDKLPWLYDLKTDSYVSDLKKFECWVSSYLVKVLCNSSTNASIKKYIAFLFNFPNKFDNV